MSQPNERYGVISGMIETAENVARDFGITREQSDAYAVRSHQRAAAAWREGRFDDEVIPISITQKRGDPIVFDHDEGYRADASIESLAALRPLERSEEHTSELQSLMRISYAVFCLKKKNHTTNNTTKQHKQTTN